MNNEKTSPTAQTLEQLVAAATPAGQEWWDTLAGMDPELAAEAGKLPAISEAECLERKGNTRRNKMVSGAGWVWCRAPLEPAHLAGALVYGHWRLKNPIGPSMHELIMHAVTERLPAVLRLAKTVAAAAEHWTIDGVEAALGMPIGTAYLRSGMIPLWAIEFDPSTHTVGLRNVHDFRANEPGLFISELLEGVMYEDDFCTHFASVLFGDQRSDSVR